RAENATKLARMKRDARNDRQQHERERDRPIAKAQLGQRPGEEDRAPHQVQGSQWIRGTEPETEWRRELGSCGGRLLEGLGERFSGREALGRLLPQAAVDRASECSG